jgi:type I restriction enzyme S subunit
MSELPEGWAHACISDLADINPKQDFDDHLPAGFVPMSHAPTNFRDKLRFDERNWGEIKKAYTNFKDGDVIFAKVTPCFENGKAALVEGLPNGIGAGSSEFFVLRPSSEGVSAKYLLAVIKSREFTREGAANMTGAVGLRRVPRQFVEGFALPVPPAAEQTRIAQKLDELLAQVDTLKARIVAIPALLKRFRRSVLAAAVSGRLTEEWREKTELRYQTHTNDYPATPLGLVADFQNGFAFKSEWFSNEGDIQVAKIGNVRNGKVDLANSPAFVSNETGFDYQRFMTIEGDLLLSMTGTKYKRDYGYACPAPAGLLVNQRVGKLRPLEGKMESGFLLLCLQSGDFREQFFSGETGQVSQGNVGSEHIKKCLIPTPTIEEQIEITRRVEQLFAFADQLETKVASAKSRIDHLTQSILAKAFRGELVPQAPNDEPASVLLERIKAQRAAAPKAKRGRKASA